MTITYDAATVTYDDANITYDGVVLLVTTKLPAARARTKTVKPGRARYG